MDVKEERELALDVWFKLIKAFKIIHRKTQHELSLSGLTGPQFGVLMRLNIYGELCLNEISDKLNVTEGNITGIIDRLEREGYVYRERDKDDRRVIHIKLTPEGERIYNEAYPGHQRLIEELMSCLSEEEQKQLSYLLKKLRKGIEEIGNSGDR